MPPVRSLRDQFVSCRGKYAVHISFTRDRSTGTIGIRNFGRYTRYALSVSEVRCVGAFGSTDAVSPVLIGPF